MHRCHLKISPDHRKAAVTGAIHFTRVDAAAFFKLTPQIEAQINVENLLNSNYFSSAYNDNNIMPGAPMTVRATVRMSF